MGIGLMHRTAAALPAPVACPSCWTAAVDTSWRWAAERHRQPVEVEYGRRAQLDGFCARANALGFESLRKHLELGPWRIPCR
jgi:hypothetical protein